MRKKTYSQIELSCTFQQQEELTPEQCINGVISKSEDGNFRFEEAVKGHRHKRNPKLYDGDYCSLVHMQNGKYQIHMKTINASGISDRLKLAFNVYVELITAFNIID